MPSEEDRRPTIPPTEGGEINESATGTLSAQVEHMQQSGVESGPALEVVGRSLGVAAVAAAAAVSSSTHFQGGGSPHVVGVLHTGIGTDIVISDSDDEEEEVVDDEEEEVDEVPLFLDDEEEEVDEVRLFETARELDHEANLAAVAVASSGAEIEGTPLGRCDEGEDEEEGSHRLIISNLESGDDETDFQDSDGDLFEGSFGRSSVSTLATTTSKLKKRKRCPSLQDTRNVLHKLRLREMYRRGNYNFNKNNDKDKFRNIRLLHELDTHNADASRYQLSFLRRRSKIIEIVAEKGSIFALTATGVCVAFDRESGRRLCFLNVTPDEVVRSLFFNKKNDSLITVSVFRYDDFSSLKCRSTPIEYIRRGKPGAGFPLFESESLRWPGFVEFDDVNNKVLTYSATDGTYKVWDLVNYTLMYTIVDDRIQEIKISPGIMLLIYNRPKPKEEGVRDPRRVSSEMRIEKEKAVAETLAAKMKEREAGNTGAGGVKDAGCSGSSGDSKGRAEAPKEEKEEDPEDYVPLKIIDIQTGETLKALRHPLKRGLKVDFIEQFNENLLVKQEREPLNIVNVKTGTRVLVPTSVFRTPSAFIFLYETQLFLTFLGRRVSVWNFRGELVTSFDDHELWHPDCNTNNIYITTKQDLMMSYCRSPSIRPRGLSPHRLSQNGGFVEGTINVSSIMSGRCLAKVSRQFAVPEGKAYALDDITALFYSEERNEIYTGRSDGKMHIWGN